MTEPVEAVWSTVEAVGAQLAGVSALLLVAGLALHAMKLAARARAWQNVLRASLPERRVRFADAAVPSLAGIGAGAVVPFGGGELLRVALVRARLRGRDGGEGGASTAMILGSLTVERALDAAVSVVVVSIALTVGLVPNGALRGRAAGLVVLLAQPVFVCVAGGAIGLAGIGAWRYRRRLAVAGGAVLRGLRVLRQPRRYLTSVASWQLLAWALRYGALVVLLDAFHVPSAALVAPIVLSLQLLAGSVPLTPAGAGTQQALIGAAFGSGAILAFSVGAQAATMLLDVFLGAAALAGYGIRPRLQALRALAVPS
jgi:Lysylphosphatidylglycerol synthase TM region